MSFVDFINDFMDVLQSYVNFLFSLVIIPGVSVGSILLVSLILWIITVVLWPRR